MTHWGYGLLAAYVLLGVSSMGMRKAILIALVLTVAAMGYAFHSYGAL